MLRATLLFANACTERRLYERAKLAGAAIKDAENETLRVAAVVKRCKILDSKTPPRDVPWFEWAEHFVGCTGESVRNMNLPADDTDYEDFDDD